MPWVFLGLAIGCVAVAMSTQSIGLAVVALFLALGFMLLGALGLVSARIQGNSRSAASMMSGEALATVRKLREAESRDAEAVDEAAAAGEQTADAEDADDAALRDENDTAADARETVR